MMKVKATLLLLALFSGEVEARIRGVSTSRKHQTKPRELTGNLPQLMGYGGEPDPNRFPLGLCEGKNR